MVSKGLTPEQINGWLAPWPVQPKKRRKWNFMIRPLKEVFRWKNPNKLPNVGRVSFDRIVKEKLDGLQDHYIQTLVHDWAPVAKGLVTIAMEEDDGIVVVDGSHRLTALRYAQEYKIKTKITHVGVLMPQKGKNKLKWRRLGTQKNTKRNITRGIKNEKP